MAERHSLSQAPCPVARSVDLIGDRWMLLILRDAFDGSRRFSEFQRGLGMARNILADRLKRLVEARLLQVQPASDGSAWQEYVLTRRADSLFPLIVALRQFGEQHLFTAGEARSELVEISSGTPLAPLRVCNQQGEELTPDKTRVQKN
ncbi:winged helix-turn-helix transcriptional regulator [Erwinia sorbitola]|uniref:Transcriptional regulator n=1 Tax=Erwinia sorbitola TaxID=2681984 RepID=A0A6I6EXE4_9GAMM|nr:helix-turn-helix domain-containing protein [Erwinia sorbitola]MTD29319.1 transcriptional regulator [Erwinia sorbitola]QGU89809.1 transcriptional regulator [Erwinia sorbitola]